MQAFIRVNIVKLSNCPLYIAKGHLNLGCFLRLMAEFDQSIVSKWKQNYSYPFVEGIN